MFGHFKKQMIHMRACIFGIDGSIYDTEIHLSIITYLRCLQVANIFAYTKLKAYLNIVNGIGDSTNIMTPIIILAYMCIG